MSFCFFFYFFIWFFLEMVFLIHSKSILGLVFRLDDENSSNCTSGTFVPCFIWDLLTHFHDFWSQLSSDFGHAVTVTGAKNQWFCGLNVFRSKIKVELENAVRTKNRFLASGFLFTISLWFLLLFRFFGSEFYLNGFPNPFIVHSRNSFFLIELNYFFLQVFFVLFTCGILTMSFCFFSTFISNFLRDGFPKSLEVRSRSRFLFSQWKFFELYIRKCPAMFSLRSVHTLS